VRVAYNGSVYPGPQTAPSPHTDLVGLLIAFVILLTTSGAFIAAGLPNALDCLSQPSKKQRPHSRTLRLS
jgi:hypothetical protein